MYTIEVYARNQPELTDITSFLRRKHIVFTNTSTPLLHDDVFYSKYPKDEYITPSPEFRFMCGKENLNIEGKLSGKEMYVFIEKQIQNPNCFFLDLLIQTQEYMATQST